MATSFPKEPVIEASRRRKEGRNGSIDFTFLTFSRGLNPSFNAYIWLTMTGQTLRFCAGLLTFPLNSSISHRGEGDLLFEN
jgi:hypothetical protein